MKTDIALQADILDELKFEPSVNAAHIGVTVKGGIVTLSGHVASFGEKSAAEKVAKRVYGVKAVADELDVKLPGESKRSDEDVAEACINALKFNTQVPKDAVKVIVDRGWVTLEGHVEWQYQKNVAQNAIRCLIGVIGVINRIEVKPNVLPHEVRCKIEAAFKRTPSSMPAASRSTPRMETWFCTAASARGPSTMRRNGRRGERRG